MTTEKYAMIERERMEGAETAQSKTVNQAMIYTPRMYLTVDGFCDITITTIINYDFWEIAPIETADYMTAYCPELLDKLAIPIFNVLKGQMSSDEAIAFIKEKILLEAQNKTFGMWLNQ